MQTTSTVQKKYNKVNGAVIAVFGISLLINVTTPVAYGQNAVRDPGADQELRKAERDYLSALDRGDRQAIAQFWAADGVYTDANGHSTNARELVEKTFSGNGIHRPSAEVTDVTFRLLYERRRH